MTETEWLGCDRPETMLDHLRQYCKATRTKNGRRKLHLFACGCCRFVIDMLNVAAERPAVETALRTKEQYADGLADVHSLRPAWDAAWTQLQTLFVQGHGEFAFEERQRRVAYLARDVVREAMDSAAWESACGTACYAPRQSTPRVGLLGDVFGNPFLPVKVEPAWLTSTVVALARGTYEDRAFDRLPILADALQDADCESSEILNHCRGPGPHVRGCWVVDLVLRKS